MKSYNTSLFSRALQIFGSKAGDYISDEVHPHIMPIVELRQAINKVANGSLFNSAGVNFFTTPLDKDFYLVYAEIGVTKDVTATSTFTFINCYIDGVATVPIALPTLTLTAQNDSVAVNFGYPGIKIDRGTVIGLGNSTNVGNIASRCSIGGYTVETTSS